MSCTISSREVDVVMLWDMDRQIGLQLVLKFAGNFGVPLLATAACIVGLSMGGQIAMAFGQRFGHRVSGMVLAATSAEAESAPGSSSAQ